jgi:MFS family permease
LPSTRSAARRQLALTALVQILVMGLWFSASSVVPALRAQWGLSREAGILLTATVQAGFAAGAVVSAVANLADRLRPQVLIALSAAVAAGATLAFPFYGKEVGVAAALRFVTGFALAGVYPTGMKVVVSWFPRSRGVALGLLLGALALGSAAPQLLAGLGMPDWRDLLLVAAGLAFLGALTALLSVKPGPDARPAPPWAPAQVTRLFRDRRQRLVMFGYFGHMWELYALWTWLPTYLAAALAAWSPGSAGTRTVSLAAFAVIGLAGAAGCVGGGKLADTLGGIEVAKAAMLVSAGCCVLSVAAFGAPPVALLALLAVWGVAVIADSGQFSAALTEATDQRYVGTALTVQTAIGFAVSVVTIQLLPLLADAVGWRAAVPLLAFGPLAGAAALARLPRLRVRVPGPSLRADAR